MTDVTVNDALAEVAKLKREMAEAQKLHEQQQKELYAKMKAISNATKKYTIRASPKGLVSLVGGRKYGIHLYKNEMLKLLEQAEEIKAFIEANPDKLSQGKDDKRFAAPDEEV